MPMPFAVLAAVTTLSLYSGPEPEPTALFRDWITGCDNERNCSAVALAPVGGGSGDGPDHLDMTIEQGLGQLLFPVVTISAPTGPAMTGKLALHVGASPIALPPPAEGFFVVKGPQARALVQALRAGSWAVMRDVGSGKDIARASLAGLTAALLRIDTRQGKVGTPRALARPGTRRPYDDLPGYSVTLTRSPRWDRPPTTPDPAKLVQLLERETCPDGSKEPVPAPRVVRLDRDSSMMIVPWRCGSGAYNHYSEIVIVDGFGEIRPATFDYDTGITGDGPGNVLVNAGWDEGTRVLESHILHRAIGDCGKVDRFIWDGSKFRLSEQRVMPECRGSMARIRVWQVDVVER